MIVRDVFPGVPVVPHKIYLFATRVVFIAVPFPMFGVARRNAQIDRRAYHWNTFNYHRLRIEKRGPGEAANINLSIKSRLANSHRHPDIVCPYRGTNRANYGYCNQEFFHGLVSIIR
jgi:hypothetical protein